MDFRFTWGDTVRVADTAPVALRPGAVAAVVGLDERGPEPGYTVEFGDGSDAEVPESMLVAVPAVLRPGDG